MNELSITEDVLDLIEALSSGDIEAKDSYDVAHKAILSGQEKGTREALANILRGAERKGYCPKYKMEDGKLVTDLSLEGLHKGNDVTDFSHTLALHRLFGADRNAAIDYLLNAIRLTRKNVDEIADVQALNGVLATIDAIEPQDAIEGMLAAQMASTHTAAMDMLGHANRAPTSEVADAYMKNAVKLFDLYTKQMGALNKHRKGGTQTVTVKHVHVHDGGQAVIDSQINNQGADGGKHGG